MADYIPILDTQVDPDAPITSSLGYQFRDNPVAISEGAPGAPKVQGIALGGIFKGFLNVPTTSGFEEILGLDRVKTITMNGCCVGDDAGSGGSFFIEYSNDGGVSWDGLNQTLISFTVQNAFGPFNAVLDLETGDVTSVALQGSSASGIINHVTTHTVPSNVNGIRVRGSAAPMNLDAIVLAIGGTAT